MTRKKSDRWRTRVVFDVDGTIADIGHRLHHLRKDPPDWEAFHDAAGLDVKKPGIVALLNMARASGHRITLVTGRWERDRKLLETWLAWNLIWYDDLYMRDRDGPDHLVKEGILLEHLARPYGLSHILFVVDDRDSVVDMWRSHGLTVLQCQRGDF